MSLEYAVIDVETTPITAGQWPKTLFWGYADSKGYKRFETTAALWKFLRYEPPKMLLHHGNFDIIQGLMDGAKILPRRSHAGRLIRCEWGKHRTLNTLATFPISLGQIFDCFGFEKTPLSDLEKRNFEDCVNGLECFLRFDAQFEALCGVSPLSRGTIAGTAFRAAENIAGRMPENPDFLEAYRGGRVECYDLREHRAAKYDVNSSYPRSFLEAPKTAELLLLRVKTKDWYCPFFDAAEFDSLLFPNGTFNTWLFADNLELYYSPAMTKTSVEIEQRHTLDFAWLNSLSGFVRHIYAVKQEADAKGNIALRTVAKLLLNSLYGRLGLRGESERCRVLTYRCDLNDSTIYKLRRGVYLTFDTIQRETRSNFPFAAYITDNARARLFRAFVGNSAFYGDTDSVYKPAGTGFSGNLGTDCGDWNGGEIGHFQAYNVKDYVWNSQEVRKGGTNSVVWTLKQMASGQPARAIHRERITELQKRAVLPTGETRPLVVNH